MVDPCIALQLENYLTLPTGMRLDYAGKRGKTKQKGEKTKEWILSDHMEALFGAIYKDSNFQQLSLIIKFWFDHLGLLEIDHQSVSSFGESQSVISELSIVKASSDTGYSAFIEYIAGSNLPKLQQQVFMPNNKQLIYALLVALSNNRTNIIPFLMKKYHYDLDIIREALEDTSIAVSSKHYLEIILIDKLTAKFQENALDDIGQVELFLGLIRHSAIPQLESVAIFVSEEMLKEGLLLALKMNNTNMVCFLVKKYIFSIDFLQEVTNQEGIAVDLRNFLNKHIKKKHKNSYFTK